MKFHFWLEFFLTRATYFDCRLIAMVGFFATVVSAFSGNTSAVSCTTMSFSTLLATCSQLISLLRTIDFDSITP